MASLEDTLDSDDYDEFGLLHENAAEWDIPNTAPVVSRLSFELPSGQRLSYLRWDEGEPELVFLHGGAQNAHTWDTVVLALGVPASPSTYRDTATRPVDLIVTTGLGRTPTPWLS